MTYGKVHRSFLRTLMSRGVMTERESRRVLQQCSDVHHELPEIISEINAKIRPLSQDIKRVKHETTGEYYVVILWSGQGEAGLSQQLYSQQDVLFWRKMLEHIAVADGKKIGAIDALNLCIGMSGITKIRAQDLMEEWTDAKYLEKNEDGSFILGIRGIFEFEAYLRLNMPEAIDTCFLCTKPVFQCKQCGNCGKFFHKCCLSTAKGRINTWPCCKQPYRDEESMEEDITEVAESPNPTSQSNAEPEESLDLSQEF